MKYVTYEERLELLAEARQAASEAAALIMTEVAHEPADRAQRAGRSRHREYDRRSEQLLRERLAARTGIAVVGEETGGIRDASATWFVDPLDGTTNFAHGHPYFCVSIGLVVDGSPVVGVVKAPAMRCEWTGAIEGTFYDTSLREGTRRLATRNGEPCAVSTVPSLIRALLATGFPYDVHTSPDNNLDSFNGAAHPSVPGDPPVWFGGDGSLPRRRRYVRRLLGATLEAVGSRRRRRHRRGRGRNGLRIRRPSHGRHNRTRARHERAHPSRFWSRPSAAIFEANAGLLTGSRCILHRFFPNVSSASAPLQSGSLP